MCFFLTCHGELDPWPGGIFDIEEIVVVPTSMCVSKTGWHWHLAGISKSTMKTWHMPFGHMEWHLLLVRLGCSVFKIEVFNALQTWFGPSKHIRWKMKQKIALRCIHMCIRKHCLRCGSEWKDGLIWSERNQMCVFEYCEGIKACMIMCLETKNKMKMK